MKNILKFNLLLLLFLFLVSPHMSFSQNKSEKVKARLIELFELVKDQGYYIAASYIVYRGADKTREWKDFYDEDSEKEMKEVEQVCRRIKSYLDVGGSYNFVKFKTETESEGEWCIWELRFMNGENKKVFFAFLKIKGKYCLGDID